MNDDGSSIVRADRNVCIGAGMCVLISSAGFDQDDEGIVVILDPLAAVTDQIRDAVTACPSGALTIEPMPQ